MAGKKMVHIRGRLDMISSERVQYKPYGYSLGFPSVWIEMDIPEEYVVEESGTAQKEEDGTVVLNLEGLNAILRITADSVDKLNEEFLKKYTK